MRELPLEGADRERSRAAGWLVSAAVHAGLAGLLLMIKVAPVEEVSRWVEMAVATPKPAPPPPEPEPPKPEPPKPKPRRVAVPMPVTPPEPEVAPPPDQPTQSLRRVQGLSSRSFVKGAGTGLTVRAGTSLTTKAGPETMGVEEAGVSWAAATAAPKCPKPALETPAAVKKAGLQGSVEVVLDVGADGRVGDVRVTRSLSPEADAACVAAWASVKCSAGKVGNDAVAVTGLPHTCTFRAVE
jgi:protein TonB